LQASIILKHIKSSLIGLIAKSPAASTSENAGGGQHNVQLYESGLRIGPFAGGASAFSTPSAVFEGRGTTSTINLIDIKTNGGTSALFVSASGNVGIGTTSPSYKLHVIGEIYASSNLFGSVVYSNTYRDQAGGLITFQDDGGNVAINKGSANATLDVSGSVLISGSLTVSGSSTFTNIGPAVFTGSITQNASTASFGGVVGIGTTSPSQKLSVVGSGNTYIQVNNGSNNVYFGKISGAGTIQSDDDITFRPASTELMRLTSTNVGIGTTSPSYKLVVSKGGAEGIEFDAGTIVAGKNYIINYNRSTDTYTNFQIDASNILFGTGTAGSERMRISSAGDVQIGTTAYATVGGLGYLMVKNVIGLVPDNTASTNNRNWAIQANGQFSGSLDFVTSAASASFPNDAYRVSFTRTGGVVASSFTGSFSGSVSAPGSTTQIVYNSGGALAADSGLVYSGSNVGIGTTSPLSPLHQVAGGVDYTGEARFGGSSTAFGIELKYNQAGPTSGSIYVSPAYSSTDVLFKLGAGSDNANQLVLKGDGNVGIGTTTPGSKLEVAGTNPFVRINNSSTSDSGIKISYGNSDIHGLHLLYNPNSAVSYIDNTYPTSSGQVYGDMYFRQNAGGTMTPRIVIKAESGNVGIGVTSPTYNLEVSGSGYISGSLTVAGTITAQKLNVQQITSSVIYSSGSNIFGNDITNTQTFTGSLQATGSTHYLLGDVGIGTTSPSEKLEVDGNVQIGSTTDAKLYMVSTGGNGNNERFYIEGYADGGTYGGGFKLSTRDDSNIFNTAVTVNRNGNVGIGTSSPSELLHISGAGATAKISSTNTYARVDLSTTNNQYYLQVEDSGFDGIGFYKAVPGTAGWQLIVNTDGNVGIGTTGPSSRLEVKAPDTAATTNYASKNIIANSPLVGGYTGAPIVSMLAMYDGTIHGADVGYLYDGSGYGLTLSVNNDTSGNPAEALRINRLGNVGIGTTTPGSKLQVTATSNSATTVDNGITILNDSGIDNCLAGIRLSTYGDSDGGLYPKQFIGAIRDGNFGAGKGSIVFCNRDAADTSVVTLSDEKMRILPSGNVGIGTTSPGRLLDVGSSTSTDDQYIRVNSAANYVAGINFASAGTNKWWFYRPVNSNDLRLYDGIDRVTFQSGSGNVGIGTTSPQAALSIATTGSKWTPDDNTYYQPTGSIFLSAEATADKDNWIGIAGSYNSTTGSANLLLQANFRDVGSQAGHYVSSQGISLGNSVFTIGKLTTSTSTTTPPLKVEQFRIDGSGNVGIGTTSPTNKLTIQSNSTQLRLETTSDPSGYYSFIESNYNAANPLNIYSSAAASYVLGTKSFVGVDTYLNSYYNLVLCTGGTEPTTGNIRLFIANGGNVGIGTTSPTQRLHVSGAIAIEAESTTTKYSTTFSGSLTTNTNIASIPTGSFKAAFFDYYVASGSVNMRAGTVMSVHNNSTSRYTDTSTGDIGNTSAVDFSTSIVAGSLVLTANVSSGTWEVKTAYRAL
jgi:hypothetical protein